MFQMFILFICATWKFIKSHYFCHFFRHRFLAKVHNIKLRTSDVKGLLRRLGCYWVKLSLRVEWNEALINYPEFCDVSKMFKLLLTTKTSKLHCLLLMFVILLCDPICCWLHYLIPRTQKDARKIQILCSKISDITGGNINIGRRRNM